MAALIKVHQVERRVVCIKLYAGAAEPGGHWGQVPQHFSKCVKVPIFKNESALFSGMNVPLPR